MMRTTLFIFFTLLLSGSLASRSPAGRSILHLPLYRSHTSRNFRRTGQTADIGLGDDFDITYSIFTQVGDTQTTLVLDTGSSDLWLVSDACTDDCAHAGVPLYSHQTLRSTGLDVRLLYGDSRTGTHASGPIGLDTVGIAGLSVVNQSFAAINDTNTTVFQTGSAGILGLGFPPISMIWRELLESQISGQRSGIFRRSSSNSSSHLVSASIGSPPFPSFDFLGPHTRKRQLDGPLSSASGSPVVLSFPTYGPLLTRLIMQQALASPLVSITLQRDTVEVGGNMGLLSIGGLPPGVRDDLLTWVPVRAYGVDEGGLPPPPDAPNETYPLTWEIPVDDVYLDGVKLPRSSLSSPAISLSALLDTGNSLIRGPRDVVDHILAHFDSPDYTFDCDDAHNLSFQIGGALFSVDPRDFAVPTNTNSGDSPRCAPALAATDPPGVGGFLYSWSLGDPFLKSALVAYYYGNLTYPSQDPPRVGLLSTVPADASDMLHAAVQAAIKSSSFPTMSDPAPSGTFVATTTGIDGVPQATHSDGVVLSNNGATFDSFNADITALFLLTGIIVALTIIRYLKF